jgi:CRISPR-associated exonuclease Cas4
MDNTRSIAISALQHYAYCPRQCAFIHTEQVWSDNFFTAQGNALHERVDKGQPETRGNMKFERAVAVESVSLGINGKLDLLEIQTQPESGEKSYFPVEYKRGSVKIEDWDRIQLCAQALCIEEMRGVVVTEGAIWYWQDRRRESVEINAALRVITIETITATRDLLSSGTTPPPTVKKALCRACSLIDICKPDIFRKDQSEKYVRDIFLES